MRDRSRSPDGRCDSPDFSDEATGTWGARRAARERAMLAAVLVLAWLSGYYAIAAVVDPSRARDLRTPLDAAIPFVPEWILGYSWVYTAIALPLFTIRCRRLFRQVAIAYAALLAVSFVCFLAFPVSSSGFRPDDSAIAAFGAERFLIWGLRLNFRLDPPVNLFPSLHLSSITLVALACGQARRDFGCFAGGIAVVVGLSLVLLKQHYLADLAFGLVLGAAIWASLVRSRGCAPGGERSCAYGWRGPLAYLTLHALVIAGLWLAFRLGLPPGPP